MTEGIWPIGYDGEPCGNAIMWCDARAGEISGRLFAGLWRMSLNVLKKYSGLEPALTGQYIALATPVVSVQMNMKNWKR